MKNYLLKISSAGNRFLIADKRWFNNSPPSSWGNSIFKTKLDFLDFLEIAKLSVSKRKVFMDQLIAHKELSLTDGLVVLKESKKLLFECDFYNKDGSMAEMCGNAACCLSFYADWLSLSLPIKVFRMGQQSLSYKTGGSVILHKRPVLIADYDFSFQEEKSHFTLLDSGVPHAVLECPIKGLVGLKDKACLKKIAQYLRFKNPKDKKGMNISFFEVEKPCHLKAMTYERGVEDWTLACGTGALAVAFAHLNKQNGDDETSSPKTVSIDMPGGQLKVQFHPETILFSPVQKGY